MKRIKSEAAQATATAVKNVILSRHLRPGDPMPTEAELVEELGVSRSSVREAVRTLVALDILEVRHGTGTFVGHMSMRPLVEALVFRGAVLQETDAAMLREVIEVRQGLDHSLAPRVVERLSGSRASKLRATVDAINAAAARGEMFAEHDRAFHLLLAEELGNELYGQLVAAFWDIHMTVAPTAGEVSWFDIRATADAHQAMLDAATHGDLEGYRRAVSEHYTPLLRVLDAKTSAHTA